MRKSKTLRLGDVIQEYLKDNHIETQLKEVDLVTSWETVMGKIIAGSTTKIYIHDRVLYVFLRSSVIRQQLFMMRNQICQALNKQVGAEVIDDIIFK